MQMPKLLSTAQIFTITVKTVANARIIIFHVKPLFCFFAGFQDLIQCVSAIKHSQFDGAKQHIKFQIDLLSYKGNLRALYACSHE